jgi:hypothetical protein
VGEQFCRIVFGRSPTYFVLPSATEERVVRAFPHWRISMRCVPPRHWSWFDVSLYI